MKKLSLIGLAFAVLIGATILPKPAEAQVQGLISSIFNKMEKNRRELRSLQASVTIQKVDARFGEEMSYGTVQFIPGEGRNASSLRLEINRPRKEILFVDNGLYTLYKPKMNVAYKGSTNKAPRTGGVLSFVFNASGAQLKREFIPDVVGEGVLYEGGPHVTMIKLTPKGGADFKFAEIWVDGNGMPVQTRVTERNGDSTLVRLTGIQRNARIQSDVFTPKLPSGVKIVNS